MPEQEFAQWLRKVDRELVNRFGLSHRDLADQPWRVWFDDEAEPADAAELALENEGLL